MAGGDPEGDPAPVVAPPAPVAPPNPGPWDADLVSVFQDEATRGQVDAFLREKIQPHVTQLEQLRSQTEPAAQLYSDLQSDPVSTYIAITQELYGDEAAQAVADVINAQIAPPAAPTDPAAPPPLTVDQLPPEVREAVEAHQNQTHAAQYASELARVSEAAKDSTAPVHDDLFHPFVVAAEGDFDRALQGYQEFYGRASELFAPAAPTLVAEVPAAPPTLGLAAPGVTPPPTVKEYKGWGAIDDALSDTLAEMKAERDAPVTVG